MSDPHDGATRWDRRRAQTYRRLLDAGEQLFRTQGFDVITVERLAAAADVAKGTFFNYFSSKEALLGALLDARIQAILEVSHDSQSSPIEQIWQLLLDVRRELMPYVHLFRQMFAYAASHPHYASSSPEHLTMTEILAGLVRNGQRQGLFRDTHSADVVGAMIATYFFRVCVLECALRERAGQAQAQALQAGTSGERSGEADLRCVTEDGESADFSWKTHMRAGLEVLYEGLVVT